MVPLDEVMKLSHEAENIADMSMNPEGYEFRKLLKQKYGVK